MGRPVAVFCLSPRPASTGTNPMDARGLARVETSHLMRDCEMRRAAVACAPALACGAWLAVVAPADAGRRGACGVGFEHRAAQAQSDATGPNTGRLVAAGGELQGVASGWPCGRETELRDALDRRRKAAETLLPGIQRGVVSGRGVQVVFGSALVVGTLCISDYFQIASMEGFLNQDFPAAGGSAAVGGRSLCAVGNLSGSGMCSSSTAGSGEGQRVSRGSLAGAAAHRR